MKHIRDEHARSEIAGIDDGPWMHELRRAGLDVHDDASDRAAAANTLNLLGYLRLCTDDFSAAERAYSEALDIYRELRSGAGEAHTLQCLAHLRVRTDDLAEAERVYNEALLIYRAAQDRLGEAQTLERLGDLHVRINDLEGAEQGYNDALVIYRALHDRIGVADALERLSALHLPDPRFESPPQFDTAPRRCSAQQPGSDPRRHELEPEPARRGKRRR